MKKLSTVFAQGKLLLLLFVTLFLKLSAQYTGSPVTHQSSYRFSDFMTPDYSCNCGTPLVGGSVPVTTFPDCGTDGNYPNEFGIALEFLGGGSNIDPAALEDKYWMIRFRNLDDLCTVWTYPFAIGDSLYGAVRTGSSIRVTIRYSDLDPDNTCTTTGFEGHDWDYQVIQICDYPVYDCYRLSVRDTFEMQEVLDMFDVSSNSPYSAYAAPAKAQFGYCETDVYVDMLLGETLSIGNDSMDLHWNDVRASLQYLNICGLDSELTPETENFQVVLRDSLGNLVDQSYFDGLSLESGDFILMDTVWYESQRCIRLTYKTDGDGSFDRWGVFAAGEALNCMDAVAVTMDEMESDDFRLSWDAGSQTTGHRFKIRVYQGGNCTGVSYMLMPKLR